MVTLGPAPVACPSPTDSPAAGALFLWSVKTAAEIGNTVIRVGSRNQLSNDLKASSFSDIRKNQMKLSFRRFKQNDLLNCQQHRKTIRAVEEGKD